MSHAFKKSDLVTPEPHDIELAAQSSKKLAPLISERKNDILVTIRVGEDEAPITVPFSAIKLLQQILNEMAQGNAVNLIPHHAMLTTQQAADLLNVSRPYLIKLLEKGEIHYEKIGTHRRIKAEDLIKYQFKFEEEKRKALDELTRQAQELNMGY